MCVCVTLYLCLVHMCANKCLAVGCSLCVLSTPAGEDYYVFMLYLATQPFFPHQNPIPETVKPSRGTRAGGTLITIYGQYLDIGSKEDIQVTVGVVDCIV